MKEQAQRIPDGTRVVVLVEGGDERQAFPQLLDVRERADRFFWNAHGRDLVKHADLIAKDDHFPGVRSVGVVLDMEESAEKTRDLVAEVRAVFEREGKPVSFFVVPDEASPGAIEGLLRRAVNDPSLSACVDTLESCAGARGATAALRQKGWLVAYFAMLGDPSKRWAQALDRGVDLSHPALDPLRKFLRDL